MKYEYPLPDVLYPYDRKTMKVSRKMYDFLMKEWLDALSIEDTEEGYAFTDTFYIRQIFKKKHSPQVD